MVEHWGGFQPSDNVSIFRPNDDPSTDEPSGEATFIRPENADYATVVEYDDEGAVDKRYTVHTSDVAENLSTPEAGTDEWEPSTEKLEN